MKNKLLVLTLLFVVGCGSGGEQVASSGSSLPLGKVKIDGHNFTVEVARTHEEQRRGLMFRTSLAQDAGMIFPYEDEKVLNFWMRSTLIPLDMIAIGGDNKIVNIEKNAQPCEDGAFCALYPTNKPAKYVLEINGGLSDQFGFKEGDKVKISL